MAGWAKVRRTRGIINQVGTCVHAQNDERRLPTAARTKPYRDAQTSVAEHHVETDGNINEPIKSGSSKPQRKAPRATSERDQARNEKHWQQRTLLEA